MKPAPRAVLALALLLATVSVARAACTDGQPPRLQPHKLNYALPLVYDFNGSPATDSRQPQEAKFQFSLQYPVNWIVPWSIGYTQKALWQLYDQQRSRPFRETNHNPEAFVDCPSLDWLRPELGLRAGIEHESNGQAVATSRSWNRVYLWPRYRLNEWLEAQLKAWYRLPEKDKDSPDDPAGDNNPDIELYLGYGELYLLLGQGTGHRAQLMLRKGPRDHSGTYQLDAFFHLAGAEAEGGASLMLQFFSGYGESLIDYNHRVQKLGIGVAFF